MSKIEFTYEDFEQTRFELIGTVKASLDEKDKRFLLSLNNL